MTTRQVPTSTIFGNLDISWMYLPPSSSAGSWLFETPSEANLVPIALREKVLSSWALARSRHDGFVGRCAKPHGDVSIDHSAIESCLSTSLIGRSDFISAAVLQRLELLGPRPRFWLGSFPLNG